MAKYRKRPMVVDAVQFHLDMEQWPEGVSREQQPRITRDGTRVWCASIITREGVEVVQDGDWIITDDTGTRHPCRPDIFAAVYEEVP
jgi:hypothetical protein